MSHIIHFPAQNRTEASEDWRWQKKLESPDEMGGTGAGLDRRRH
jgi:hypothetical protein